MKKDFAATRIHYAAVKEMVSRVGENEDLVRQGYDAQ
jgi:hypothetical protein